MDVRNGNFCQSRAWSARVLRDGREVEAPSQQDSARFPSAKHWPNLGCPVLQTETASGIEPIMQMRLLSCLEYVQFLTIREYFLCPRRLAT